VRGVSRRKFRKLLTNASLCNEVPLFWPFLSLESDVSGNEGFRKVQKLKGGRRVEGRKRDGERGA
jgi:hypothetical protein